MRLPASPLALAGLALLVGINGWLLLETAGQITSDDVAPIPKAEWTPRLPDLQSAEAAPSKTLSHQEILARPIFSKSRAPYVPPPPPAPKPMTPPPVVFVDPGFIVGGIMINGSIRKAYLSQKSDRTGVWVGEGDDFVGWKVQSVSAGGATLRRDNHTIDVQLYAKR